jgi:hypothetical protein
MEETISILCVSAPLRLCVKKQFMKTPRDLLFAHHQTAVPKLEAIRREVVRELNNQETKEQSRFAAFVSLLLGGFKTFCCELVFPCRRIWTGLAAVWLLLFIVNFSQRDNVSSVTGKPVRSGEIIMSVQAQQRWVNELLADRSAPPEADRPRNFAPKPRTEKSEIATV